MSATASHQVLTDLVLWLLLSLPLALLVYGWQRRRAVAPEPVPVSSPAGVPCDRVDGLVALALILAIGAHVAAAPAAVGEVEIGLSTVLADLGAKCLVLLVLLVFLRGVRGRVLSDWLGLHPVRPGRFAAHAVAWGCAGAGLVYLTAQIVSGLVLDRVGFAPDPQEVVRIFSESRSLPLRASLAFTACLVSPVVEETLFRGFLYPVVRRFTDGWFAAVFTGLLFGLVHRNLHGAVPLAVLGVVLALAYERGRGIGLPIAIHALFNTASIALLSFAEPTPPP